MSDQCAACEAHCCGMIKTCRPVLMPWEDAAAYETEQDGPLVLVKRNADGWCVYFDHDRWHAGKGGCTIYHRRPFECCIYPLVLDFSRQTPGLKLDPRAPCASFMWPAEWIARYVESGY